ncbi:MAG: DEAD/DEAH box helicase [Thermofilaceae archaeon]
MPVNEEALIRAYHEIITQLEIPRAVEQDTLPKEGDWYAISKPTYSVTKEEVIDLLRGSFGGDAQHIFDTLVKRGFLIPLSSSFDLDDDNLGYRSLHMDVLCRSSEIRTAYDSSRYLLSSKLAYHFVTTPTKDDRCVLPDTTQLRDGSPLSLASRSLAEAINYFFEGHQDLAKSYMYMLKQVVQGLDAYQALALRELLRSDRKIHVIVAPTGSGKTEIFLLYALAWLIKQRYICNKRGKVLLVYPRKALTADQASRIIKILHISSKNNFRFIFAIRDGDTPHRNDLLRGTSNLSFRGIECPLCNDGELVIKLHGKNSYVVCGNCGKNYDFVRITREEAAEADVIATNQWALEARLLDNNPNEINTMTVGETGLIVVDEAHEYKGFGGGLFNALLNAIRYVRSLLREGGDLEIILSSATIPEPSDFASKLAEVSENELQVITYDDVKRAYGERAISGRRLVISGLFSINPQFSWNTYCQLWLVLTTFLCKCYELREKIFPSTQKIQSVLFVNNIRELKRVRSGFLNNLALGEPRDHLNPQIPANDPFCYWHYIPRQLRKQVKAEVENLIMRKVLENKLVMMLSELEPDERTQIIGKLRRGEGLAVLSTSSLELGVDYKGVMFILNAGLENPISLLQRIGRGGRSAETLRTVLGIILARASVTEAFLLYDREYLDALLKMKLGSSYRLFVTVDNPQVKSREKLLKAIASLALDGEQTYASGKAIESVDETVELLEKILTKLRNIGD